MLRGSNHQHLLRSCCPVPVFSCCSRSRSGGAGSCAAVPPPCDSAGPKSACKRCIVRTERNVIAVQWTQLFFLRKKANQEEVTRHVGERRQTRTQNNSFCSTTALYATTSFSRIAAACRHFQNKTKNCEAVVGWSRVLRCVRDEVGYRDVLLSCAKPLKDKCTQYVRVAVRMRRRHEMKQKRKCTHTGCMIHRHDRRMVAMHTYILRMNRNWLRTCLLPNLGPGKQQTGGRQGTQRSMSMMTSSRMHHISTKIWKPNQPVYSSLDTPEERTPTLQEPDGS